MNLLIIPARGGSKRIPRKNIKIFKGKPIIEWTISTALSLKFFDTVIVSTDNDEIAALSQNLGVDVPFIRPSNLADDHTPTRDVILHAINWYKAKNIVFNYVCCLYPTSIFIRDTDIDAAFNELKKSQEETFIFSAISYSHPIKRSFLINKKGLSEMFFKNTFQKRTQDLENSYHDAGQFYIAKPEVWINKKVIFDDSIPFILQRWQSVDIDTYEDWSIAEIIYEWILKK